MKRHQVRSVLWRAVLLAGLCWLGGSVALGCTKARKGPPNVLLISVDTLRADHLSCYGYSFATSPNIDRLAAESTRYADAIAPTAWTLPSHAGLLTGVHPWRLGLIDQHRRLPEEAPALAAALQGAGYQTAAIVDSSPDGFVGARRGFGRGFTLYRHARPGPNGLPKEDAAHTVAAAVAWLEKRDVERPFFLFLHTKSVHSAASDARSPVDAPYHKPKAYLERFLDGGRPLFLWTHEGKTGSTFLLDLNDRIVARQAPSPALAPVQLRELVALYDAGVYYVDEQIGRLLAHLERLGVRDDTVIVLTADHGEAFLEHGLVLHQQVYQELLQVPLIVHDPAESRGTVIRETVHLEDVMPTLLRRVGLEPVAGIDGVELPRSEPSAPAERESFSFFRFGADLPVEGFALRRGRHKLVQQRLADSTSTALYDLERDPHEREPLVGERALEQSLLERLERRRREFTHEGQTFVVGPETREELRALGYAQ
jgi:arylsulfatase A-like enzyme